MSCAVCTIAQGRQSHLHAVMEGLAAQTVCPDLLVIAVMQESAYSGLPDMPFPVRQEMVCGDPPPLAKARNAAVAAARTAVDPALLVLLDVDCVPAPDLVAAFERTVDAGRCVMGNTRYLARDDDPAILPFETLWERGATHPARDFAAAGGEATVQMPDMGAFWSLSFAMSAADFRATGGFDERFVGYGGEDTDFARSMAAAGLELHWDPNARAVHQWHRVHIPPLGHFSDIVRNARLFRAKHGRWCMEYWLNQLHAAGYVDWDEQGDRLDVLRRPSADELKAAVQGGDVRFS